LFAIWNKKNFISQATLIKLPGYKDDIIVTLRHGKPTMAYVECDSAKTEEKCNSIGYCYFESSKCKECKIKDPLCSLYKTEESCNKNVCALNAACTWDSNEKKCKN